MKKTVALAVGFVALVVGGAGLAWACTAQASLGAFTPFEAPPGTAVTVAGSTFEDGPVEIRWGGPDGPVIGVARGPNFSTSVTIPPAAPGVYYVVAVSYDEVGEPTSRAKPFEVTAPAAEPRPPRPVEPNPVDESPVDQGPVDESPVDQAPVDQAPVDQAPVPAPVGDQATPSAPAAGPAPVASATPVDRPARPNAATGSVRPPVAVERPPEGAAPPAPLPAAPEAAPTRPAAEVVSGDLWRGFAAGPDAAAPASLTGAPSPPTTATLTAGIALLAAGLAVLFAGALATVTARRRSPAGQGPAE